MMTGSSPAVQARRIALLIVLLATVGCGSAKRQGADGPETEAGPLNSAALSTALAELAALPTPEGVAEDTFAMLKREFEQILREQAGGRGASRSYIELEDHNSWSHRAYPLDFAVINTVDGATLLEWNYTQYADANLDGRVDIKDITPLGIYFQKDVVHPQIAAADTNDDGKITLQDLSPIGTHFLQRTGGYEV
jgi:hypothetical protein